MIEGLTFMPGWLYTLVYLFVFAWRQHTTSGDKSCSSCSPSFSPGDPAALRYGAA